MIIWDELQYGKDIYENGVGNTKYQNMALQSMISYMMTLPDMDNKAIREELNQRCGDNLKYLDENDKKKIFNRLITKCKTYRPITGITIPIYVEEIEFIKAKNDLNAERVLFVMLVYKKWLDAKDAIKYKDSDKEHEYFPWFNLSKGEIHRESKTNGLKSKVKNDLLYELCQDKSILSAIKKPSRAVERAKKISEQHMWSLPWMCFDGDIAFKVDDYRELVFWYLNYVYGGYGHCEVCGKWFKKPIHNNKKYCTECAKIVLNEQKKTFKAKNKKCQKS